MSIINAQNIAKLGYAAISIGAYASFNSLKDKLDKTVYDYLPESWHKWIPTSLITKVVLVGGSGFAIGKLQTWSQPTKVMGHSTGDVSLNFFGLNYLKAKVLGISKIEAAQNTVVPCEDLAEDLVLVSKVLKAIVEGKQVGEMNTALATLVGNNVHIDIPSDGVVSLGVTLVDASHNT